MNRTTIRDGRQLPFFQVVKSDLRAIEDACAAPGVTVKLSAVRSTYFALLEFANDDRAETANVTRRALADRSGVSSRTSQEATGVLELAGVLRVEARPGSGSDGNIWVLLDAPNRQPLPVQTGSHRRVNRQPPPVCNVTSQEEKRTPLPPLGGEDAVLSLNLPSQASPGPRADHGAGDQESSKPDLEAVWDCYVATMAPRQQAIHVDERRVIRDALKVASLEECCQAIRGCAASPFHMGQNERGKKYNKLTQILRGKRGGKTLREQIDMYLEIAETVGVRGGSSSADDARMKEAKRDVLTAWDYPNSEHGKAKGVAAARWLAEHGTEIVQEDGSRPTFKQVQ